MDDSNPRNNSITWLHITDWHIGQSGEHDKFPNFKNEFFRDLSVVLEKTGGIDLVFFSGDLVNSGSDAEFDSLEERLGEFWNEFAKYGTTPILITTPGNHDIARPPKSDPVALALKNWHTDSDIREAFWDEKDSSLRDGVAKWFLGYEKWVAKTKIPQLPIHKGTLPGDFFASFQKGNLNVGILGLNTTFLQFRSGNLEGQLAVSSKQIPLVDGKDYVSVLGEKQINLLMTHQPPGWLHPQVQADFKSDIAPSGLFDLHLCGHLHTPSTSAKSFGGGPINHIHQGASFFGLDKYGENGETTIRQHGYAVGKWQIDDLLINEQVWPRVAVPKQDGAWGLVADPSSYLNEKGALERNWRLRVPNNENSRPNSSPSEIINLEESLFKLNPSNAVLRFPTLKAACTPQHLAIRNEERQRLRSLMQVNSTVCIVADWGTAKDDFIASALLSKDSEELIKRENIFVLKCDAFTNVSEVEIGFQQQMGVSIYQFSQTVGKISSSCIIFDGIQPELLQVENKQQLITVLTILQDFAPSLKILLTGRVGVGDLIPEVTIGSLDAPETRAYLEAHPQATTDILSIDTVERFHFVSGGLPIQIDRLLNRLQVASLDAVLQDESTFDKGVPAEASLQKALLHCIRQLEAKESENPSYKGLSLLRALSILPYGETIDGIKRFISTKPFYVEDADELFKLTLIDSIPVHQSSSGLSIRPTDIASSSLSPKILRAPKQVRDCVLAEMTPEQRRAFLGFASDFMFGSKWRTGGKIKLRKVPFEYKEYVGSGLGNEYAVIKSLISIGLITDDSQQIRNAARLGIHYCGVLKSADRYNDLKLVSKSLIRLLEDLDYNSELRQLHQLCGRACRLTGSFAEAVTHFEAALDIKSGQGTTRAQGHALLELGMSYSGDNKAEEAIRTIEKVTEIAKHGSLLQSQARTWLINHDKSDKGRADKLSKAENEARSNNWNSHANDIALIIYNAKTDTDEKISVIDRVLKSGEDGINQHRAIIEKAKLATSTGNFHRISYADEIRLLNAYSYAHAQRSKNFEACHEALWLLFERKSSIRNLYTLFKHSSFIWRIKGDSEAEVRYFQKLQNLNLTEETIPSGMIVEIEYFSKRAKVLILRLVSVAKNSLTS